MDENSTIFFFYDDLNEEKTLYSWQDLSEATDPQDQLYRMLNTIEYSPSDAVLQRIFQSAKN